MYQAEALWLHFACEYVHEHDTPYPFAISVAAGETNAVTGDAWSSELHDDPQDYMVAPTQPWLDGYCVKKGLIRQFVAMPLGAGYTAEEQITGAAEHGGIQIVAYPMKREAFERHHPKLSEELLRRARRGVVYDHMTLGATEESRGMGLAPGGTMKQEIYDDRYGLEEWRTDVGHRCFVHLANSMVWRAITGEDPPTTPPTAREYSAMGLPWFDYYAEDATALKGSKVLKKLKSVTQLGKKKGDVPLPENQPVDEMKIVKLREGLKKNQIREGTF
jgi:hypothetical protein